jgi:hypothetical protein
MLVACNDEDFEEEKRYTIYCHLDSNEHLMLNDIADLSNYMDLDIDVVDIDIALAQYDWESQRFIIIPLKLGNTIVTVKEKNRLKYKIELIVEYEGVGNWDIKTAKHTVICDATIKEEIEYDLLNRCLFYNSEINDFCKRIYFENSRCRLLDINGNEKPLNFSFINLTKEYEFSDRKTDSEKQLYTFSIQYKSDIGVYPQHKIGTYYIDRTTEYRAKYPEKNISRILEEYKVECRYPF